MAVAVSGGPDSLALLHATWRAASALGLQVYAFHVDHALQAASSDWPLHIERECRRWVGAEPHMPAIECRSRRLNGRPARGTSVEEWARTERYRALTEMAATEDVSLVLLAHHAQDQAETFLLQAMRGAGPEGLAAMPAQQWMGTVCIARPWLQHSRAAVRGWVQTYGLVPVEDPSNADLRWDRNRLRHTVLPALQAAFPNAMAGFAEAARQCGRALGSLGQAANADRAAALDETAGQGRSVRVRFDAWLQLGEERRAQVLRAWLRDAGEPRPGRTLVERVARESIATKAARWPMVGGGELRWYRSRFMLEQAPGAQAPGCEAAPPLPTEPTAVAWRRAGTRELACWSGALVLRRAAPGEPGLPGPLPLQCIVRMRSGGDRFAFTATSTPRSLKKQFQARAMPAWARCQAVVTDTEGAMLLVPGLGMDGRACMQGGRWVLEWRDAEALK